MLYIKYFVGNLTIIMIIMASLLNLVEGSSYAKYLRYLVGMITVIYLLNSVNNLIADKDLLDIGEIMASGTAEYTLSEGRQEEMIAEYAMNSVNTEIENAISTSGYENVRVETVCEADEYYIYFYTENKNDMAGIKKYISDFYHIGIDNIVGFVEEENE